MRELKKKIKQKNVFYFKKCIKSEFLRLKKPFNIKTHL
jgi:hypothetical protein